MLRTYLLVMVLRTITGCSNLTPLKGLGPLSLARNIGLRPILLLVVQGLTALYNGLLHLTHTPLVWAVVVVPGGLFFVLFVFFFSFGEEKENSFPARGVLKYLLDLMYRALGSVISLCMDPTHLYLAPRNNYCCPSDAQ